MAKRIFVDSAILVSVFLLNSWITLILVVAGIFYFRNFYEAFIAGIMIDALYGVPLERFFHIPYVATIVSMSAYFIIDKLKERVRFHE
jgi:hypothetical protein